MNLTESQRAIVADMLRREALTEYERGQLSAWRLKTTDPADRALLNRAAQLEVK